MQMPCGACSVHSEIRNTYRRKALYPLLRSTWAACSGNLRGARSVRSGEGLLMVDHVIKLLSIPPKYSISQMMGYINGKSATHIARTYGGRAELCGAALLGT